MDSFDGGWTFGGWCESDASLPAQSSVSMWPSAASTASSRCLTGHTQGDELQPAKDIYAGAPPLGFALPTRVKTTDGKETESLAKGELQQANDQDQPKSRNHQDEESYPTGQAIFPSHSDSIIHEKANALDLGEDEDVGSLELARLAEVQDVGRGMLVDHYHTGGETSRPAKASEATSFPTEAPTLHNQPNPYNAALPTIPEGLVGDSRPPPSDGDDSTGAASASKFNGNLSSPQLNSATSADSLANAPSSNEALRNEVQVLKRTLAIVIAQRDSIAETNEIQQTIIRDLSLVVDAYQQKPPPAASSSKPNKPRKTKFFSRAQRTGRKGEATHSPPTGTWVNGWLLTGAPLLHEAETAWATRGSSKEALGEVRKILSRASDVEPKDLVEAMLLRASILRSTGDKKALDACEEALEFCYEHNLSWSARKAQFHKGQTFLWNCKHQEAAFAFALAQGVSDGHAEQLAVMTELATQKKLENSACLDPDQDNFWNIPAGFYS